MPGDASLLDSFSLIVFAAFIFVFTVRNIDVDHELILLDSESCFYLFTLTKILQHKTLLSKTLGF